MAREINLVPEIKNEMIKALKLRNLIFFICIVAGLVSLGIVAVLSTVVGGQQIALNGKDSMLSAMSKKINSYDDLGDFLTIRDQVEKLDTISNEKNVFSRTFGILAAIIPTGPDRITISKLNVDLTGTAPKMHLEAQANAEKEPYIDYNVLDAFKKSMPYMRYDYGDYVDYDGSVIPAYCMIETDGSGAQFSEYGRGNFALWTILEDGCTPAEHDYSSNTETYDGKTVVRVWRTPQFDEWYGSGLMTADGKIDGVAHFESACIKYSANTVGGEIKWTETNDSCLLVPKGTDGIVVNESSNGREASGDLVLRFSATITFDPEVYKFRNKHMVTIAPSGRYNVTDSYIQIREMFSERAADCAEFDATCKKPVSEETE